MGRSSGGFSTKINAITDVLGNLIDFVLTPGQDNDIEQAETLLELTLEGAKAFCGDKGYDSDALVDAIEACGMKAVIPPRSNHTEPRECNWFTYKERHLIECFFNKIKHYRQIFHGLKKRHATIWASFVWSLPPSGCDKTYPSRMLKKARYMPNLQNTMSTEPNYIKIFTNSLPIKSVS